MKKVIIPLMAVGFVAACGGAPSNNQMTVDRDGANFSGTAGSDWTDQDLRTNAFAALCPKDQKVANLIVSRDEKGVAKFSGTCVK
ncbi:hypothetical protein Q8W37_15980 [Shimia thalassica]|uniref:hypothetical protein n=1 Tax=Shimia thalassica TaxID=1715693 RepID=UPI0027340BEE|nr:hypothetical protein [Shimia thalassica]MDP2581436.1 hypothetical protein [Shimia thalassica]